MSFQKSFGLHSASELLDASADAYAFANRNIYSLLDAKWGALPPSGAPGTYLQRYNVLHQVYLAAYSCAVDPGLGP